MSEEFHDTPPPIESTLWVHKGSGNLYEVLGFGLREEDKVLNVEYWDGQTKWHRPVHEFSSRFELIGVLE